MVHVILSLGSNTDAERNILMAEERLKSLFPAIRFSGMLTSRCHDGSESVYGNAVGIGETALPYHALRVVMKLTERYLGRTPARKSRGVVDMDIDILQYGTHRLKDDDWHREYNTVLLREMGIDK